MEAASVFLRTLFGAVDHGAVLIWTGQNKKSDWIDLAKLDAAPNPALKDRDYSLGAVLARIDRMHDTYDVYFGLGVQPQPQGTYARGTSDDVIAITGVWADIDILGPMHKKQNLPPTLEDVMAFLAEIPLPPTIINQTGGGVHVFWLFREPWLLTDEVERQKAKLFVERWQKTLKVRAAIKRWEIDATHDLARIFRVPGTRNHKYGDAAHPAIVETIWFKTENRSDPSEFEPFLLDLPDGPSVSVDPTTVNATFDDVEECRTRFNSTKRDRLYDIVPKLEATWKRLRKDFAGKDTSPSAYDMALCNAFIEAGWTDQEIVDALVINRSEHRDDPKWNRPDYYAYTLAKARATAKGDPTILEAKQEIEQGLPISDPIKKLNTLFKFDPDQIAITGWYEQGGRQPTYMITTTRGNIVGVPQNAIQDPKLLNRELIAQKRVAIPLTTKFVADWGSVVVMIILQAIRDEMGFGDETTILGAVTNWLQDYLINNPPVVTVSEATRQRTPFIAYGHIHVSSLHLRPWISKEFGEKDLSNQILLVHLREYGAEQVKLNVEALGGITSRTVWRLPDNTWTRGVVRSILWEHTEKGRPLPPTALARGATLTDLSDPHHTPDLLQESEYGVINLTPKDTGWEHVVSEEEKLTNSQTSAPDDAEL